MSVATYDLPDNLGSAASRELATALVALRGEPLAMNAARVRRIGAQCAQVLLSAAATWRADGLDLTLDDPSPEFQEAMRLLGLPVQALTASASAGGDTDR